MSLDARSAAPGSSAALGDAIRRFAALLAGLVLTACSLGQDPTPSPSTEPTPWQPTTPWEKALDDIGTDGQYDLEASLKLFATAFGPLPGTDAVQDLTGIHDRTVAISAVMNHADDLTAEQRSAIDDYIKPPADAVHITVPSLAQSRREVTLAQVTDAQQAQMRELVTAQRQYIADHLPGGDFEGNIEFYFKAQPPGDPTIMAQAWSDWPGGSFGDCHIIVYAATFEQTGRIPTIVAHELFHCFQFDGYGTMAAQAASPRWILEGQADWVGETVGGPSGLEHHWRPYLWIPYKSLTQRIYDAIGFYSHLAETGTDPWTIFPAMWAEGTNNIAAFEAADANREDFLDSWASGVLRAPARGSAWTTTGPNIPADMAYKPNFFDVVDGGRVDVSAPFFTNDIKFLTLKADMVHFRIEGYGRLSDGQIDTTELADVWYCVEGHDCEPPEPQEPACPGAPPPPPPPELPDIAGTIGSFVAVATSGGIEGTIGVVEGLDIERPDPAPEQTCETEPPTPTPRPDDCQSGCGMSNGDPHIGTIDDHGYDFQAIGEFVLLRSADGSFEVQGRQGRYGDSDDVSINSAVAMKLGSHRAGIYVDAATQDLKVLVDGQPYDPGAPPDLGAGAAIRRTPVGWDVDFPDGSRLQIVNIGFGYGFNIILNPSDAVREAAAGIFGPVPDGDGLINLPALPDGSAIPESFGTHDYWEKLYVTFADAWRITDETSLFDYGPGESTATFTLREFPAEPDMITIENLTPEQIAAGEAACAGIGIEFLRQQCIFDVGYTGVDIFGDIYDITADVVEQGSLAGSGEKVRVINLYANEDQPTALDIYGWSEAGAALLETVEYGQVSDFFDPGVTTNEFFGQFETKVTMQRRGEPLNDFRFNLLDVSEDNLPGTVRTFIVGPGDPRDLVWVGGTSASWIQVYEQQPGSPFLPAPLSDQGMLTVRTQPMHYTVEPPTYFYLSVGDGCLADHEFPTVPVRLGGGFTNLPDGGIQAEGSEDYVAIPPGQHMLTLHLDPDRDPNFDCSGPPSGPGVPVTIGAGEQAVVVAYVTPGDPQLRLLVVPYGQ